MARRDTRRGDAQEDETLFETQIRAIAIVDELLSMTSASDSKYQYLLLLRHQLETDERQMKEAQEVLGQFEEAYAKLTETASKIGMYLGPLEETQKVLSLGDTVSAIEFRIDDIYKAPEVAKVVEQAAGKQFAATHWQEQNKQILSALKMDRVVTLITIGLIELIAGLNILISLVMMVMEKNRDIAILVSMGAQVAQVRKIFILQGLIIGGVGTAIGLVLGYGISFLAGHYRWIQLDEAIYSLSFVPFEPRLLDALWVAAASMLVSYLATLYPARAAARILPVESLRYE